MTLFLRDSLSSKPIERMIELLRAASAKVTSFDPGEEMRDRAQASSCERNFECILAQLAFCKSN